MDKFQQELNSIKPPDQLVADTMKKMHEANQMLRAQEQVEPEETKRSGGAFARNRLWVGIAAAAACLAIAVGVFSVGRAIAPVPMAALNTEDATFFSSAANRGGEGVKVTILPLEEFESHAKIDAVSMFRGFTCVSTELAAFQNQAGDIVGDYGVFAYQNEGARLTLYVSTTDLTAPAALLLAEKVKIGSSEVHFGRESEDGPFFAAWTTEGTSFCLAGDGITQRSFVGLLQKTLS